MAPVDADAGSYCFGADDTIRYRAVRIAHCCWEVWEFQVVGPPESGAECVSRRRDVMWIWEGWTPKETEGARDVNVLHEV